MFLDWALSVLLCDIVVQPCGDCRTRRHPASYESSPSPPSHPERHPNARRQERVRRQVQAEVGEACGAPTPAGPPDSPRVSEGARGLPRVPSGGRANEMRRPPRGRGFSTGDGFPRDENGKAGPTPAIARSREASFPQNFHNLRGRFPQIGSGNVSAGTSPHIMCARSRAGGDRVLRAPKLPSYETSLSPPSIPTTTPTITDNSAAFAARCRPKSVKLWSASATRAAR